MANNIIRIKRGLKEDLPALLAGELGYCFDTKELFIGRVNPANGFTENALVNDLSDLANYYTKSEIEGFAGLGLTWNSGDEQFDVIIATKQEAEAGEVDSKLMTPERTAEAISFQTSGLLTSGDIVIANQEEAEAGENNTKFMTPLRTAQAIAELSSAVTISTTAPASPKEGDLWWDSSDGTLYIYFDPTNDPAIWVEVTFGDTAAQLFKDSIVIEGDEGDSDWVQETTGDWEDAWIAEMDVVGILDTDEPIIDLDLSDTTFLTYKEFQDDFALIFRIEVTEADKIKFYASDEPDKNLKINIKVVR